ncbi:MAG TPA: glutathione S-transferase family protein [Rhizomicrobium sp.]|nr:glutathione S-transferase family protein [Rhizomicrobium sp.]
MKLYDEANPAPNPRKVRVFLAEKGIDIARERVPLMKRAHKSPEHLARNPLGQVPVLELDDGTFLSESIAICRYIEALHPDPPLFGSDAKAQALVEMWIRRVEFCLWTPMGQVWINDDPRTAAVNPHQFPEYGRRNRKLVAAAMKWLDAELADGRPWFAGAAYSMADIALLCGVDFAKFVNMEMPDDAAHLRAWHERASARPSAAA